MKKLGWLLLAALACGLGVLGGDEELITINSVVSTPRYPWNGIWDIVVDISMPENKSVGLEFEAKDSQTGKRLTCGAVQRSDGGPMLASAGKTRFVWFTDRDLGPGITEHVAVGVTPVPYMIVDVGGGPDATGYPVSIQYVLDIPASTGWTDEYKTTKIPMRWIRPEVFNREGFTNDYPQVHANYWVGVFETTQRQYEMVTGLKRGTYKGPMRPVETLSLQEVTNFVSCLKRKTGRKFGLPAFGTWEYACRAGSVTPCYDGTTNCVRKAAFAGSGSSVDLGRYSGNRDDGRGGFAEHTTVGSYVPNAYGLYDMLGNVHELADIYRERSSSERSKSWFDSYYGHFVGDGRGDYERREDGNCYYVGAGFGSYVYKESRQRNYVKYQGGGYQTLASAVKATAQVLSSSYYSAVSTADVSWGNLDSQPTGFDVSVMFSIAEISKGAEYGFRLFCDAE